MLRTPGKEERNVWNDAEAPEPPANLNATLKGAVIHRFCETYRDGDEPEVRLATSFDEVTSQRQSELAGREFDINRTEAVRALFTPVMNPTATVASVSAPRSKRLFPCRGRIVGPTRGLRLDVHNRFPATHIFKPVKYSCRNGVFAGL